MNNRNGKIIAAFGIPGSGKSTTTAEIGNLLNIKTFLEPEEEEWGEAVFMKDIVGDFTTLMWFRAARVPLYYKALEEKKKGNIAMLDSMYDKLFSLYYDQKGLEWFYDLEDIYFDEMVSIVKKDYENLPDIDIVVFLFQTEENWQKFTSNRNREFDNNKDFKKSFGLQDALLKAAKLYCKVNNKKLIIHKQSFISPRAEAIKIIQKLKPQL